MKFLGIDIGGANIKVADANGYAATTPFALWREPERLAEVLAECLASAPEHDALAATTTGELADCFATKRAGIRAIYTALQAAAAGRPIHVYLTDGRFVVPDEAIAAPQLAAASNWHALAAFAARFTRGRDSILIDVGSTTTDIIPIQAGIPSPGGRTDSERLVHGELVYVGVRRTPLGMLVSELPWRGKRCPIARELFATTLDAHLILGDIAEDDAVTSTADGQPATRDAARARLARMVAADCESFDESDVRGVAGAIAAAQRRLLGDGLARVASRLSPLLLCVVSGEGEFLARQVLDEMRFGGQRLSLTGLLGEPVSQAAAAYALAVLAGPYQETAAARSPAITRT